jgi:hypothetical protein
LSFGASFSSSSYFDPSPSWEIKKESKEFQVWWFQQQSFSLFFDRSSKKNPRVASVVGFLYDPKGNKITHYGWELGKVSNNLV